MSAETKAKLLSRKFIMAVMIEVLATGLCMGGLLTGAEWVTISSLNAGAFGAGNVGEHAVAASRLKLTAEL